MSSDVRAIVVALLSIGSTACLDESDPLQMGDSRQAVTTCADGPTVPGIDVSKWQGAIDWHEVKNSGVEFAFIRVSDGLDYVDGRFSDNWLGAREAGVIRGAYQFFRPNLDPIAQADLFLAMMGDLKDGDLPPVIDIEVTGELGPEELVPRAKQWLEHVEAGAGARPIVYTSGYFWGREMLDSPGLVDYELWAPHWGPACPNIPEPWTSWKFFQTSDEGVVPGISGPVDLNVFNGDLTDLQSYAVANPCAALPPSGGVIDDRDGCFDAGGPPRFIRNEDAGFGGTMKWTVATDFDVASNYAQWNLKLERAGAYRVEVHIPAPFGESRIASYRVAHGGRLHAIEIDQAAADGWVRLGDFDFDHQGEQWIRLDDNTGDDYAAELRLVFDAVRLTPVAMAPPGQDLPDVEAREPEYASPTAGCGVGGGASRSGLIALFLALVLIGRHQNGAGLRSRISR